MRQRLWTEKFHCNQVLSREHFLILKFQAFPDCGLNNRRLLRVHLLDVKHEPNALPPGNVSDQLRPADRPPGLRRIQNVGCSAYLVLTLGAINVVHVCVVVWYVKNNAISGLLALQNVVLVPHMASATAETRAAMYDLVARNVVNVLQGQPPVTPIP